MSKPKKPQGNANKPKGGRSNKPGAELSRSTRVPQKRVNPEAAAKPADKGAAKPATKPAGQAKPKKQPVPEEGASRLIIIGSPRSNGRSANLAELLFEACIEECPQDELALAPVSELNIAGCTGCGYCARPWDGAPNPDDPEAQPLDPYLPPLDARCAIKDDMRNIYELADDADELTIVSPVFFGSAPSQMKAVLDRLQPYFCARARRLEAGVGLVPKRPAVLHVVGEGGDPFGFDALVVPVRSALACAGFKLETVYDWVGKIDADGEIVAEADRYELIDGAFELVYSADDEEDDGWE